MTHGICFSILFLMVVCTMQASRQRMFILGILMCTGPNVWSVQEGDYPSVMAFWVSPLAVVRPGFTILGAKPKCRRCEDGGAETGVEGGGQLKGGCNDCDAQWQTWKCSVRFGGALARFGGLEVLSPCRHWPLVSFLKLKCLHSDGYRSGTTNILEFVEILQNHKTL